MENNEQNQKEQIEKLKYELLKAKLLEKDKVWKKVLSNTNGKFIGEKDGRK